MLLKMVIPDFGLSYQDQVKILEPLLAPGCIVWWGDEAVKTDVEQLEADIPCHTVYVIGWDETRNSVRKALEQTGKTIIAVIRK